jgi:hypothetical protein
MSKRWASLFLLSFGTVLSLALSFQAQADFIIKFTDGGQVIVHRYAEEGQTIKIYTSQGTISFRKDEVERITEVDANQSMGVPLEMVTARPSVPTQASSPDPSDGKTEGLGSTNRAGKERATEGGKATEAERERIDQQYQDITQEFDELWEEHLQKVSSGVPETALQEDLRRLNELDHERRELIRAARKQIDPDKLPTWAQ